MENASHRAYRKEMGAAGIMYVVLVLGAIPVLSAEPPLAVRVAMVGAVMVPIVIGVRAVVRAYRRGDELFKREALETFAFAFGGTAVAVIAIGLLQIFAGFPALNWFWVWAVMGLLWIVGGQVAARRYR